MRRLRILVVDDEPTIIKFLRANLEANGYETLAAMDGAQALQVVERELPDLIILDIMMPKIDGFEVLTLIRQRSNVRVEATWAWAKGHAWVSFKLLDKEVMPIEII